MSLSNLTLTPGIPHSARLFMILLGIVVLSVVGAVVTMDLRLLAAPALLLVVGLAFFDYRLLYFLLWASIPISTEVVFDNGFGTNLPDEPLMVLFFGIGALLFALNWRKIGKAYVLHPITLCLMLHLGWIILTTLLSDMPIISLKFLAAKCWYIVAFYLMAIVVIRRRATMIHWLLFILTPLVLVVLIINIRHGLQGFTFEAIGSVLNPFFRNHVDYALLLGLIVPFVWYLRRSLKGRYTGLLVCALFIVAIYLAYTRAAYLGLVVGAAGLVIVHFRLVRIALLATVVVGAVAFLSMQSKNTYIDYAPDYYKTITHHEFDDLLEATVSLEDISTMERFHRWIAGSYMIGAKPVVGFGPGNFFTFYKSYTNESFVTFISDNEEGSGIHNYFLMTAVEQGLPGLFFFLLLIVVVLLKAEWLYHRLPAGFDKDLLRAVIFSLFFILFILVFNDMIESDKVGSFFFFNLAMIVVLERRLSVRKAIENERLKE
jgi:O-antigen ligase